MQCTTNTNTQDNEISTSSGLRYTILKAGEGDTVKNGQEVLIYETVSYLSGAKIYSTREMGNPFKVLVGGSQVIKGVDEGLLGMQAGELRKLIVPTSLSKRTQYPAAISADSVLVYEIELVEIVKNNREDSGAIALRTEILKMDSLLFIEGFNRCNTTIFKNILSDNIEFYDDREGLNTSKEKELKFIIEKCAQKDNLTRTLKSATVSKLGDYGALQMGNIISPKKELLLIRPGLYIYGKKQNRAGK